MLNGVSFCIKPGQNVFVLGKSGSGKSALLEICAGLRKPDKGNVYWDEKSIKNFSQRDLNKVRQEMGFVFQQHALISNMSVFDNLALCLRYHTSLNEREIKNQVRHHLEIYDIVRLAHKLPEALSVGQSRIVAIARALVMQPKLLFLDEPIAGLDPIMAQRIFNILTDLCNHSNLTILIVNHTISLIEQLGCPILFLHNREATIYPDIATLRQEQQDTEFVSFISKRG